MSARATVSFDPTAALRWLDVVLVLMAAPFALAMGAPALGYAVGAAAWILSRVAASALERKARGADDIKKTVGIALASSIGRAWAVGLSILAVGLAGEREDGATAAILVLVAFTVFLGTSLLVRMLERNSTAR
jgi:hypothetical protein